MPEYDCTDDVMVHRLKVGNRLLAWAQTIRERAIHHDESKLLDPLEKATFDKWSPELRKRTFGTDEYKAALEAMGEGVKRHYRANRHHPEHFENGVNGMTLIDVLEMVADWEAAADRNGLKQVDLEAASRRFNLSPQLVSLIANTLHGGDHA